MTDSDGMEEGYCAAGPLSYKEPKGPKPMCYCGDECALGVSGLFSTLWMRYWKCPNTAYDASPGGYAPPLCDYKEWIDTEIGTNAKQYLETHRSLKKWENEMRERRTREREREEEIKLRREEERRKEVENRNEERERKRERARRAKAALESGGADAVRKGKWPRCTQ